MANDHVQSDQQSYRQRQAEVDAAMERMRHSLQLLQIRQIGLSAQVGSIELRRMLMQLERPRRWYEW